MIFSFLRCVSIHDAIIYNISFQKYTKFSVFLKGLFTLLCAQTNQSMTELIIVEDCPVMMNAIENVLKEYPEYKVTIRACNGYDLLLKLQKLKHTPTFAIVDICMPKMDGVSLTQFMSGRYKEINVIGISAFNNIGAFSAIMEAGAKGFIYKSNLTLISEAIQMVLQGEIFIDPEVKEEWENFKEKRRINKNTTQQYKITTKETEHLILLSTELTIDEIAAVTYQTKNTINQHQKDIKKKTGFATRTSQVMFGIKQGFVKVFRA